jgi:hypothetical protein
MSSNPIVDRIRIIPRPSDFLDRNVGASGELFYNRESSSLRVYNGKDVSGYEIARADLNNVSASVLASKISLTNDDINWIAYDDLESLPSASENHGMFAHVHGTGKAYYAHAGNWVQLADADESGGASVDVSDSAPLEPSAGNLWLDTNTGKLYIYINDGDSSQWIQPKVTNTNISYESLINKPTLATVATSGSYTDLTDKPVISESGFDGVFSSLTGTPTTLAGYGITDAATSTQGATADTAVQPSDLTGYAPLLGATFSGLVTLQQTSETLSALTGATGVVVHDLDNGAVFNHTSLSADFTANFTNVSTTADRTTSIVLILNQGATAYIPSALQIDGVVQNINWLGASAPSGNASQIDLVSFTLIRTGTAWTVIGSLTTYG